MINQAYPNGIVKYAIKYQSIVPEFNGKIISKEVLDEKKMKAVKKNFPFTNT